MRKLARPKRDRPLSPEEKYGHIWAGFFVSLVLALLIALIGKACA